MLAIAKGALPVLCIFMLVVMLSTEAIAGSNEEILAAARAGDRAGVETAFAAGASVNAVDKKGLSPLGLAGLTPLGLAAAYGHRNIAEFLLDHGANVDAVRQLQTNAAEHSGGVRQCRRCRLSARSWSDVNERDIAGLTPLEWAALGVTRPLLRC